MKGKSKWWSRAVAVFAAGVLIGKAWADSPSYPRVLLNCGDYAVLAPPEACFNYEIGRLKLPPARYSYKAATEGHELQTADAELNDLALALRKAGVANEERQAMIEAHSAARGLLRRGDAGVNVVAGLPDEFADYFRGSIAWHNGDRVTARYHWELLLSRPAEERHFKSTWAAFMLGKFLGETEPERAIDYLRQARSLASSGFADSAGLAAASVGWEARIHRQKGDFANALELYLDQHASGDESALNSLRFVASDALYNSKSLSPLTTNSLVRRVVTAFAISDSDVFWGHEADYQIHQPIARWLEAVEKVETLDPEEAEMLALAAYRGAAFGASEHWIKRSPTTPLTLWLQAKLQCRAGKLRQAIALLNKVHAMLPEPPEDEELPHDTLANNVFIPHHYVPPRQHVLGELGVLHMAGRNYVEALDCFLRGSFWVDAAYVAERVLTVEELKSYIDREWRTTSTKERDEKEETAYHNSRRSVGPYIRHLLARRLVRNFLPARVYFPDGLQSTYDDLMSTLKRGETESLAAEERAVGWFEGATLLKKFGLELIGTELEPDWHISDGRGERPPMSGSRTNEQAKVLTPTADELSRARRHNADPEERFHYRYQAAFIALQAASLLPDNSDQKARILCTAGTWLKDRDPQTADIFYKHLVRRCRKTPLGAAADVKRWFPEQDFNGDLQIFPEVVPVSEPESVGAPVAEELPIAIIVD